jgi:hypothetical protein
MTKNDENELHRLTNFLSKVTDRTDLSKDEKEALKKAALALSIAFIHGHRKEIEDIYENLDSTLSPEQQQYLRSSGLKNGKLEK